MTGLNSQWFEPSSSSAKADVVAPVVLAHEGLGSVSSWGRFPAKLAETTQRPVLVYDRAGYGQSTTPRWPDAPWPPDFMHHGADELNEILKQLTSTTPEPPIVVGHSDGASIALLQPSRQDALPVAGIVSLSAHVFVEDETINSIASIADDRPSLTAKLDGHHHDAARLFDAWTSTWLSDAFRPWTIDAELAAVRCPVLAIQGSADRYGTSRQLERLAAGVSGPVEVHEIDGVDHWPHREAPEEVLALVQRFCQDLQV